MLPVQETSAIILKPTSLGTGNKGKNGQATKRPTNTVPRQTKPF